ncbi:D-galactonate transporter [Latimeria chalumnae]|uniref:Major facilitator superfamily (MFS) profile domain-containing protein n=1 Tax=Latimeria chalumnae TaxID=7897 RepID=H3BHR1_LATCH|nr:PREDICTED: D-galactonate transporter-like [Latimeria chalumnae]|eukprot:XP_014346533.1 PREDICTED: D-galactonate transporter-like [Latimeria chalumnae]
MGLLDFRTAGCYPVYVLCLLLIIYLLNQLDRYILAIVILPLAQEIHFGDQSCLWNESVPQGSLKCNNISAEKLCWSQLNANGTPYCKWDYNGNGWEYQLMAGPIFILIYTFMGVFVGFLADTTNRKNLLAFSLFLWSLMTFLMGFAKAYWHLMVLRFGQGLGEAGCTPFAASLIADYFPEAVRGSAMGFYNWGIYTGYSLSFVVGNFITKANIMGMSWRWTFFICGIPGFLVSVVVVFTVREPKRTKGREEVDPSAPVLYKPSLKQKLSRILRPFLSPSLLVLCLAGSIRNAGGYVWGYNAQIYFNQYYPEVDVGEWLSWIPLIGGSFGVLFGGFISDRVVKKSGLQARVWVLVLSQMVAAPFLAGALWLSPPYCFLILIPAYIIGEMWVGVTLAILVELVPSGIRTSAIAVYLFIITNIGGNMPLLVPPLTSLYGLRIALLILYPGMYVLGSLLFLVTVCLVRRDQQQVACEDTEPLLTGTEDYPEDEGRKRQ